MKIILVLLIVLFTVCFMFLKKSEERLELFSWLFYSIMFVVAFIGFISFFLSFYSLNLNVHKLNIAFFIAILIFNICIIKFNGKHIYYNIQKYQIKWGFLFTQLTSAIFSLVFGLIFFTTDLIPSSMTGDPARHFQSLFDLEQGMIASGYKTIYRTVGSSFLYIFKGFLDIDKLFVLFNIIVFWMANNICNILLLKIVPSVKKRYIILCSVLTCSGYSYFSLQYGYYTLLLSSVFLFLVVTLCIEYINKKLKLKIYTIITLFMCAIALAHSYLLPEAFILLMFFTFWRENIAGYNTFSILKKYVMFWIVIIVVTYFANIRAGSIEDNLNILINILPARGYVNDDIIFSLSLFAILSIIYLLTTRKEPASQAMTIFLYCGVLFTISMFFLMIKKISAPYYVNRNLIFFLPILTIITIAFIQRIEIKYNLISKIITIFYYSFVITLYISFDYQPLSKSDTKYSELKNDNKIIHYENARNASKSPLQMTKQDRDDFIKIRKNKIFYFGENIKSIPVLGTDHETIWFGIYTNIYPSIIKRNDGFIQVESYFKNYNVWKSDPSKRFIVLIKNNNFVDEKSLRYIENYSKVVLEGDSYKIMEKIN